MISATFFSTPALADLGLTLAGDRELSGELIVFPGNEFATRIDDRVPFLRLDPVARETYLSVTFARTFAARDVKGVGLGRILWIRIWKVR